MTYSDQLFDIADNTGCIPWQTAMKVAKVHSLLDEFLTEYNCMIGENVDVGELLVWMGY